MNITTYGARFYGGQIDRIDSALIELGHRVNSFLIPPDFIYANDASNYNNATCKWLNSDKKPKRIFNVLDLPFWLPNWTEIHEDLIGPLNCADIVTCISQTVQYDIKKCFLIDAKVIYNPIKDITNLNIFPKIYPFISVGRVNDIAKNFNLVKEVINRTSGQENNLIVCGGENPFYGQYKGIVSDEELNLLLNQSKYMIYPAYFDGLGLTPIEALCAGVIPILCNNSLTSREFFPDYLLCDPNVDSITNKIIEIEKNISWFREKCLDLSTIYRVKFDKKTIAQNILDLL